ncbi:hypothetical protein LTR12_005530 [Friedmanniomyces endolithicus]|nr:hypothetical protein LTR74_015919 [Friedmanniomyces endolithicus]KAK1820089.1 hypothetical protein LTR12_005530 [Friedmanniomyces endolithicus]
MYTNRQTRVFGWIPRLQGLTSEPRAQTPDGSKEDGRFEATVRPRASSFDCQHPRSAEEKCKAKSDEDSEIDDEDLQPKKSQKKRKSKNDDGAADAQDDSTGPSAAENYARELPGLEAALEKEKAAEPDPAMPKQRSDFGYLDPRNTNEILALDELLAQDLQDFRTIIDNKYGYTSKNAKDQELGGTNRRLDIGKFMGTCRNLKIPLEDIASDEMPDAARIPPEKHTHVGRMCLSWLRMVRRVFAAAKQARVDDDDFPGGIH